jgi:hypothetical protein
MKDAALGGRMFFKGKLNPLAPRIKNIDQVRRMFKKSPVSKEG